MAFKDLSPDEKIIAVHTDLLRHPEFCILGSVSQVGKVFIDSTQPTAATNGVDAYYNPAFISSMNKKQLRYLVAHENAHKMLRHCVEYRAIKKKYPELYAMAVDYVVNWHIEEMDTKKDFLERPTNVPPLIDAKYGNMSVPEVVRKLLDDATQVSAPMDAHLEPAEPGDEQDAKEQQDMQKEIERAVVQGEIVQVQLRQQAGNAAGSKSLSGFVERHTDWRGPLRRFITDICEGDEQSRFSPPNKRMLPLGFIMPSHFSESTDSVIVAVDCSGSMGGIVGVVLGEVANIAKTVRPKEVLVLFWDTQVAKVQRFTEKDYDGLPSVLAPIGGGGTTVSCVADYIAQHKLSPKCVIYLTDAYVESSYRTPPVPCLWGVVDHPGWVPLKGKALHIRSET